MALSKVEQRMYVLEPATVAERSSVVRTRLMRPMGRRTFLSWRRHHFGGRVLSSTSSMANVLRKRACVLSSTALNERAYEPRAMICVTLGMDA